MPNDLQHITPGNIIRADLLNTLIDGVQIARNLEHTGGTKLKTGDYSNTLIRVQNNTGQTLQQYSIVSVAEPLFSDGDSDDFQAAPAFVAEMPSSDREVFAVLQKPAAVDEIVPACVSGASVVKIEVSGEEHKYAKSSEDTAKLHSSETGYARILWKQDGTGEVWGIVLFPAGGGGTSAATYGIISEHIGGHRFNDDEDYDAEKPQGKIKIIGKEYPEGTASENGEPCICNELAEDDNELLLTGLQVKCIKVDEIDNPDYVDDDETPDEPEKITRWTAVETEGEYYAPLDSDLTSNGTSTITLGEHQFTVHPVLIPTGKKVASGMNIIAHRTNKTLAAISHPCPVSDSNSN